MYRAVRLGSLREVLGCLLQRGLIDLGFIGGALRIAKLAPDVAVDAVLAETGFRPEVVPDVREVAPPTADELHVLRDEVDPAGVYLKDEEPVSGSRR